MTHHKHPNLGKAPSKNKGHKSKSDVKSPATVQVASNNGRKCYICNDPNHLAFHRTEVWLSSLIMAMHHVMGAFILTCLYYVS